MRNKVLFILSIAVFFYALQVYANPEVSTSDDSNESQPGTINIPINPLINLNGVSRDYVLGLRRQYVGQYPSFAPQNYQPNTAIYGQIQDGKPWWGILGLDYYGPGQNSIQGSTYLSEYIVNPYLLIGVANARAHIVSDSALSPKEITPMPTQLMWEQSGAWGLVTYDISDYYRDALDYHYGTNAANLSLEDLNARDFGFNFFAIDSSRSSGIKAAEDKIIPIIQFIHTGDSCGYPGGCNNRSPTQEDLLVSFTELPARIYLKLWKTDVGDASKPSDMDFIVDLK